MIENFEKLVMTFFLVKFLEQVIRFDKSQKNTTNNEKNVKINKINRSMGDL